MTSITQSIYMAVGASGAMTDVTDYVDFQVGVTYDYGRNSEFDDTTPGSFSFTLDNLDGRFTPENPNSALDTTLTEGMVVCWQLGNRLTAGTIESIEPAFPNDEAAWSQVRISCGDGLGDLARTDLLEDAANAMERGRTLYLQWPLDDAAGKVAKETVYGNLNFALSSDAPADAGISQGVDGVAGISDTQLELSSTTLAVEYITSTMQTTLDYPAGTLGAWGIWVTVLNAIASPVLTVEVAVAGLGHTIGFRLDSDPGLGLSAVGLAGTTEVPLGLLGPGPNYISWTATNPSGTTAADVVCAFYINGELGGYNNFGGSGTVATNGNKAPTFVSILVGDGTSPATVRLSRLAHTLYKPDMHYLLPGVNLGYRANALTQMSDVVTFGQHIGGIFFLSGLLADGHLWEAAADGISPPPTSLLDAINNVMRTEQGYLSAYTADYVTSPTEVVLVRPRERPTSVTASFDVEDEGVSAPEITRDITNLLRTIRVDGPTESVYVIDPTITSRAASVGTDGVELLRKRNLAEWGEDRLIRGANTRLRIVRAAIDAFTATTDRSDDLTSLLLGDRIELTGLPSTQLGFSTWEGWLLGGHEEHAIDRHLFELHLQPVLDDPPVYDTDRFMADGALTLNADIDSSVTSLVYDTTGPEFEDTNLPVTIVIDSEQMSVTACNQSTNTLTLTRGANSTTAAAHSAGAEIELATSPVYAF